jgi:hypothetical protein
MTMARAAMRSPWQMSRTFNLTRSQARSLLSIPRSKREIARSARQLEPDADRPDFFQLERRLLANQLALVPRFRVGTSNSFIHGELLKVRGRSILRVPRWHG